jgi:hypothetical protein
VAALVLAGCDSGGGDDPKSLAKQSYELYKVTLELSNSGEATGLITDDYKKKADELNAKIERLSAEDKKICDEELVKLFGF